jgi:hypothetical protein
LEKENSRLRDKCERTDLHLIDMVEEVHLNMDSLTDSFSWLILCILRFCVTLSMLQRSNNRRELDTLRTQKERLEGLCRTLQVLLLPLFDPVEVLAR